MSVRSRLRSELLQFLFLNRTRSTRLSSAFSSTSATCHGAVIPRIVSKSFVSCNGAPSNAVVSAGHVDFNPAAEQAEHSQQRPAQAAPRISWTRCDAQNSGGAV